MLIEHLEELDIYERIILKCIFKRGMEFELD
jgi:hypothetical protein